MTYDIYRNEVGGQNHGTNRSECLTLLVYTHLSTQSRPARCASMVLPAMALSHQLGS